MLNGFIYLLSFFITIPIFATWLTYIIISKWARHPLRAVHFAVTWTTPLYVIAVIFLIAIIFDVNVVGIILALLLISIAIIIMFQWKRNTEVLLIKAVKLMWRFTFLLFFLLYCLFVIIGIVQRIFF
ncbi:DUF3397 family protein [Cerasibacillus sp. JNUCC 74]